MNWEEIFLFSCRGKEMENFEHTICSGGSQACKYNNRVALKPANGGSQACKYSQHRWRATVDDVYATCLAFGAEFHQGGGCPCGRIIRDVRYLLHLRSCPDNGEVEAVHVAALRRVGQHLAKKADLANAENAMAAHAMAQRSGNRRIRAVEKANEK